MFVYSEDTSMDTRMQLGENLFDSMVLMNEVDSFMYDRNRLTYACSQWSMTVDMFSVILPPLATISGSGSSHQTFSSWQTSGPRD